MGCLWADHGWEDELPRSQARCLRPGGERLEEDLRTTDPPWPRGTSRNASAPPSRYLRHQRARAVVEGPGHANITVSLSH